MKPSHIQILGLCVIVVGFAFIIFLYSSQPRSLAEVSTKGQVAIGTYEVKKDELERGIALFRSNDFIGARAAFERADPEKRDAGAQFYVAYSYYRQGWGRVSNDDALFKAGLDVAGHVMQLDANYRNSDGTLQIKTASELKNELEEGLNITLTDFDPRRFARERK